MSTPDQTAVLTLLSAGRLQNIALDHHAQVTLARVILEAAGLGHLQPTGTWRPRSWEDRLAALPLSRDELIDGVARAIYQTHADRALAGRHGRAPRWENASEAVRQWVKEQACAVLTHLRSLERGSV